MHVFLGLYRPAAKATCIHESILRFPVQAIGLQACRELGLCATSVLCLIATQAAVQEQANKLFASISEANMVLSDPVRRKEVCTPDASQLDCTLQNLPQQRCTPMRPVTLAVLSSSWCLHGAENHVLGLQYDASVAAYDGLGRRGAGTAARQGGGGGPSSYAQCAPQPPQPLCCQKKCCTHMPHLLLTTFVSSRTL
jgi:hypothetical protein